MTTLPTIVSTNPSDFIVITQNNQLVTDSFSVAQHFGKRHDDVLRKLKSLNCSVEFANRNFTVCYKNNELQNNKPQPFYQMTKNGFMFLVMGFNGKRAAEIKEAYIKAFDDMQARLSNAPSPLDRQRMMLTWENGRVVAAKTIDENHFISTREELPFVIKDPGFLSLDQLMTLNEAVNQRIACFVRVALGK